METLTTDQFYSEMPTIEAIDNAIRVFKNSAETSLKGISYRSENYYNCVDDYSSGGICDRAANENISACNSHVRNLEYQKINGSVIDTFFQDVLCDLDGKVVSERVVKGRFGDCWIIGDGADVQFIGCAKKQATYNAKGFQVMQREFTTEFYFLTKEYKGNLITKGRILSEKIIEQPNVAYPCTRLPSVVYSAKN
jgi:hypothetical protein